MIGINRRSATENGYALGDPALKSRAKFTWSLRDREGGCCIYFSKTINAGVECGRNPRVAAATVEGGEEKAVEYSDELTTISTVAAATGLSLAPQPALKRRP